MELKHIKETVEGFEVRDLRYKPLDNIIVGYVYCQYVDKMIVAQWNKQGKPIKLNKGRTELILKIV